LEGFPQAPQWAPGTAVGDYEILEHLASGGMAEVYAAAPRAGGDVVVIKAMSRALLANEEFVRLFLDEAQLVAALQHPNIGRIFDRGAFRGTHYFVMEYMIGPSCRDILNRAVRSRAGCIPLPHAIDICCDIASALHYAHERRSPSGANLGIVHRDVSHSNVLVTYTGHTKLIDFGVAKSSMRSTETKVGSLKGKVRYMSPEQIRGEAIDRRSDLFALGIILWEMTTGHRLFRASNEAATMHKILYEEVRRPSDALQGYPPELEHIVLGALARDPRHRPSTAEEMGQQLADFARRAGLRRGGVAEYLRTLFGDEIDRANAHALELRRRSSHPKLRPPTSPPARLSFPSIVVTSATRDMAAPPFWSSPPAGAGPTPTSEDSDVGSEPPPGADAVMLVPLARSSEPRSIATSARRRQSTKDRLALLLFAAVVIGIIAAGLALSQRGAHPRGAAPPPSSAAPARSEATPARASDAAPARRDGATLAHATPRSAPTAEAVGDVQPPAASRATAPALGER
jgi:eukaryotic-like serine/threonine-protein kinase